MQCVVTAHDDGSYRRRSGRWNRNRALRNAANVKRNAHDDGTVVGSRSLSTCAADDAYRGAPLPAAS